MDLEASLAASEKNHKPLPFTTRLDPQQERPNEGASLMGYADDAITDQELSDEGREPQVEVAGKEEREGRGG